MYDLMLATLREEGYTFKGKTWRRGNITYAGFKTMVECVEHAFVHYLSKKNNVKF